METTIPRLLLKASQCFLKALNAYAIPSVWAPQDTELELHPPYPKEPNFRRCVNFPGARQLAIFFDPRCDIPPEWVLKLYKVNFDICAAFIHIQGMSTTTVATFTGSGTGKWPPILVEGNDICLTFEPIT